MKDYSEMSDFEVNLLVAKSALNFDQLSSTQCLNKAHVQWSDGANWHKFDPCNNPSDAWPIIKSNLISLTPYGGDGSWWEAEDRYGTGKSDCDNNPLRAAMVVYLMMKDRCGHCGGDGYVEIKHTEFEIEQHLCHHCNKEES